ncbi:flavin reductase family protein [Parahaliea sp. F7430]|uniref:Flavin reductase family protein n=1 Tax=Sediminihaliea albiluteola TaxID=2758564 RepID=A0A7W2YJJ0_9GAMM|nr:flavin reductase family protein [Sediminihaliea albiluteola]MBA6412353.1 flavin reductase family protein [Sediminihaliea albiluteola]
MDGRELRNALGRFATGVCLITTTTRDQLPIAMTVNSFAAVSLEPPLVLWSLQNNSEVYQEYAAARYFNVNVLCSTQQSLSNDYARKGDHAIRPEHFSLGKYGAPVIRGALVTFECEMDATHAGGDHLIIVGQVRNMTHRPTGKPLLFYSGGYGEIH